MPLFSDGFWMGVGRHVRASQSRLMSIQAKRASMTIIITLSQGQACGLVLPALSSLFQSFKVVNAASATRPATS